MADKFAMLLYDVT